MRSAGSSRSTRFSASGRTSSLFSALLLLFVSGVAGVSSIAATTFVHADDEPLGDPPQRVEVEPQPLGANIRRVTEALEYLGAPLPEALTTKLQTAAEQRDADELQKLLDPQVLLVVQINPESRVKVLRGPARASLQQGGFTPVLLKVLNASTVTKRLRLVSPQGGAVYAGASKGSLERQRQTELNDQENTARSRDRFLALELFAQPPMTDRLSGLEVEYAIGLIYSHESGRREATLGIDLGQGNQDLGFRGETPILFDVQPAIPVSIRARDVDGAPTVARLEIRDRTGRVYPPQAKRLAPDFFFQPQIYRADGDVVWLPPGDYTVLSSRGPEYRVVTQPLHVDRQGPQSFAPTLRRWITPSDFKFYSGDHHIHGAGCAHYTVPTEGVAPEHMFQQVKGEGLNVGCVLTWGPCFRFQRQYFEPRPHGLSDAHTILKYDLEISGFGSQALGHVCLLNLTDQTFPGSDGLETKGWPTWTLPVMQWAKQQGGFTGYAHSASGLHIDPEAAGKRLLAQLDANQDGMLTADEAERGLLPQPFATLDADRDRHVSLRELVAGHDRAADQLPNLALPEMNGVGAMEIFVTAPAGACDFISAMDTRRIQEWNTWYHLLNCGFPLKVSGETDFPCMSSRRVGQGRVYVQLDAPQRLDFSAWCAALAAGRSYVSDGYAHALQFDVSGVGPGFGPVRIDAPRKVPVAARVAFAPETPRTVAQGLVTPVGGRRLVGDTVELHVPRDDELVPGGERVVELIVNGVAVAKQTVPADGAVHDFRFDVEIGQSSWVALRHFPQLHTNPVEVLVGERPIRASRDSARWCLAALDLLWSNRRNAIAASERPAAEQAYNAARAQYQKIIADM